MPRSKPYHLHPEARDEIEAAYFWYSQRSPDATVGFVTTVNEALDIVTGAPRRWPAYLHGTRRFILKDFPFSVVYLENPDDITIVAVAHHKRRPGYWKQRL